MKPFTTGQTASKQDLHTAKSPVTNITQPLKKTQILASIAETVGISQKEVNAVLVAFQDIIGEHVKKAVPFSFPGVFKLSVVAKGATPERKGINPFTHEPTVFKAKPAYKTVKIKALKKLKELA
jgi:nucleoid DNA-binding protein